MTGKPRARQLLVAITAVAICNGCFESGQSNHEPVALSDSARTRPQVPVDIDVLANDSDPDGDALSVELVGNPTSITARVLENGRLRLTPVAGRSGTFNLPYRVRDSHGALSLTANVSIVVGPTARALLYTFDANFRRILVVADTEVSQVLLEDDGPCQSYPSVKVSSDGATILATHCNPGGAFDLVVMRPLETNLLAPVALLSNLPLLPIFIASPDGRRAIVAQRSNADTPQLPGQYELLEVDTSNGDILRRLPLDGVDLLYSIRDAGGNGRLLAQVRPTNAPPGADGTILAVSMNSGEIQTLSENGKWPIFFESTPMSDDGRFIAFVNNFVDIVGYDLQNPGHLLTFWPGSVSPDALIGFAPGTTTLLVRNYAATGESEIWRVPLETAAMPTQIASFRSDWTNAQLEILVREDHLAFASDSALFAYSDVREVGISDGAEPVTLNGLEGILLLEQVRYVGPSSPHLLVRTHARK